jgi:hypothetical protein
MIVKEGISESNETNIEDLKIGKTASSKINYEEAIMKT